MSRIVAGKLRLEMRPVDLGRRHRVGGRGGAGPGRREEHQPRGRLDRRRGRSQGDPDRLQQVVWNLLANAIKFTPSRGRVDVRLERAGTTRAARRPRYRARHQSRLLPHIFDRFRQAEARRADGGLGLGLAIVRHIVELHGGTVRAESRARAAERVHRRAAAASERRPSPSRQWCLDDRRAHPARQSQRAADPGRGRRSRRVRAPGDDSRPGRSRGHRGGVGRRGAREASAVAADVLVSDIGMPGDDGYALIRKVRALRPTRGTSPGVGADGVRTVGGSNPRAQAGFQTHVTKPVDPLELTALIGTLVPDTRARLRRDRLAPYGAGASSDSRSSGSKIRSALVGGGRSVDDVRAYALPSLSRGQVVADPRLTR